jgi:putative chitinase
MMTPSPTNPERATAMNAKAFFDHVRGPLFANWINQQQVDGCNAILDLSRNAPPGAFVDDRQWLAYMLATAYHETAHTMQPIGEYGGDDYLFKMYDPAGNRPAVAASLGNDQPGDGVRYKGRGYVQLTGRANYRKLGQRLSVDLEGNPELVLQPTIAAQVMSVGMTEGLFTGAKLGDFFRDGEQPRWIEARRIINGLDRAHDIASYATWFYGALQAADAETFAA